MGIRVPNSNFVKEQKKAKIKYQIMKEGMIPIYRDEKIFIYNMSLNENIDEIKKILSNMSTTSSIIYKYDEDLIKKLDYGFYPNMIEYKYNDEESDNIEVILKNSSKLYEMVHLIEKYNYVNLYLIANNILKYLGYEGLKNKEDLCVTPNSKINVIDFTKKEKDLSYEDKVLILKNIFNAYDIDIVFEFSLSEFINRKYFNSKPIDVILELAKRNSEILYNSEFSDVYEKIISEQTKTLKKIK